MNTKSEKLLLKDEVFQVVGCAIEVLNTLGHDLVEKPYENALVIEFWLRKIPFQQQPPFDVVYKGQKIGIFVPDLIAFNSLVVDTKVIEKLSDHERGLMLNYLLITGLRVSAALDKFKGQLKSEVAPAPPLAPNEFQSRLRQATIATADRARLNNVKLPDRFQLGFDEFTRTMPDTPVTPLLGQELSQIQMLINILLDAKVDSVTSFHRAPISEEHKGSPTPTPSPAPGQRIAATKPGSTPAPTLIQRNVVDVSFKASPSAARKVINEITASTGQFFIIRTLYVHNEKDKGPPRERATVPVPPPSPH